MRNSIVEKLRGELAVPIDTEPKVVYFLCETRKLLDYDDPSHTPSPLRMFCHWALHVDLHGLGTTKPFVQRVDEVVSNLLNGNTSPQTVALENALFREFTFFETLRQELRRFLVDHHLPTDLCDDDDRWFAFLAAYAGVIEDGSLFCKLTMIDHVQFTKDQATAKNGKLPFAAKWVVALKDEYKGYRKLVIRVESGRGGLSSSYHLAN